MPPLKIEIHHPVKQDWVSIGEINTGDPDGSISDNHKDGRDVYLFGVDPIENQGYVKKSIGGADVEIAHGGNASQRVIDSLGFVSFAALGNGESCELEVRTDVSGHGVRRMRLTYTEV